MAIEGLRPLMPGDSAAVIGLVEAAYGEYPGCVMDLPGVDADLPDLADRWEASGGGGWVVEDEAGSITACVGWAPTEPGVIELKRLYVAASARGRGLGAFLVALVLDTAREHGVEMVELWSDTRFLDAHRLYERCGFVRQPTTRDLHDPSNTTEYHYLANLS